MTPRSETPLTAEEPVHIRIARRILDRGTPYTEHERERLALLHLPDILATLDAARSTPEPARDVEDWRSPDWYQGFAEGQRTEAAVYRAALAAPDDEALLPAPPLPEEGCECGACRYLRRKQAEAAALRSPAAAPVTEDDFQDDRRDLERMGDQP